MQDEEADSRAMEQTLALPDVHATWEASYYFRGHGEFYERAFDEIVRRLEAPRGATILDAGCGQGSHALRLAARGYRVIAADFSPAVLELARERIERAGLSDVVRVRRENLLHLSFPNESLEYVLCWAVLMHVPEVERAIAELSRVVKDGGVVVVSEGNRSSLDAFAARLVRGALGKRTRSVSRPSGIETWKQTSAGPLLARRADVDWLIRAFERNGLLLEERRAGELTEAYTKIRSRLLSKAIHRLNLLWFSTVKSDRFAASNLLFFTKHAGRAG